MCRLRLFYYNMCGIYAMYVDNNSLVLVYDKRELNNIFFDNEFDTDIVFRYLKQEDFRHVTT